jgi:predicted acyltransferase
VVAGLAWGAVFPINKNLWTSSYVLLTAGLAMLTLAACLWAIDLRGWRQWARPFESFGLNAIAVFLGSGLMARVIDLAPVGDTSLKAWVFTRLFATWLPQRAASLAFAICFVGVWMGIAEVLRRRGVFLKV